MKSIVVKIALGLMFVGVLSIPGIVSAQQVDPVLQPCSDPRTAESSLCKDRDDVIKDDNDASDDKNPLFGSEGVITTFISTLSIVVGVIAVITIIAAGFRFVVSGSNPNEVNVAREMILYACVALVLASVAQFIVRFWLDEVL